MADASIPISEVTLARLRELARWAGVSVDDALEQAVKDQYDCRFWAAVNAGYAALRRPGSLGRGGSRAETLGRNPDGWAEP